jgi:hypothetical protein
LRFAMDVTGIFIFAKDFGTARSFDDSSTDELFTIMKHCEHRCFPMSNNIRDIAG